MILCLLYACKLEVWYRGLIRFRFGFVGGLTTSKMVLCTSLGKGLMSCCLFVIFVTLHDQYLRPVQLKLQNGGILILQNSSSFTVYTVLRNKFQMNQRFTYKTIEPCKYSKKYEWISPQISLFPVISTTHLINWIVHWSYSWLLSAYYSLRCIL